MNQSEQKSGMSFRAKSRRMISSVLLVAMLFVGGTDYSQATQQAQTSEPQAQADRSKRRRQAGGACQ